MWYVARKTGNISEDAACAKCRQAIPMEEAREIFVPRYVIMKKYGATWQEERKVLFPGYFFIDAQMPEQVKERLALLSDFAEPVCVDGEFIPLYEEEQSFLEVLLGNERVLDKSVGDIVGGSCTVFAGPLQGRTESIRKIDRHKRLAEVAVKLHGKERRMKAALEIVQKIN